MKEQLAERPCERCGQVYPEQYVYGFRDGSAGEADYIPTCLPCWWKGTRKGTFVDAASGEIPCNRCDDQWSIVKSLGEHVTGLCIDCIKKQMINEGESEEKPEPGCGECGGEPWTWEWKKGEKVYQCLDCFNRYFLETEPQPDPQDEKCRVNGQGKVSPGGCGFCCCCKRTSIHTNNCGMSWINYLKFTVENQHGIQATHLKYLNHGQPDKKCPGHVQFFNEKGNQ